MVKKASTAISDAEDVAIIKEPRRFTLEELAQRAEPALKACGAERAIAFGSWARGTADAYSDLDLAVVLDTGLPARKRGSRLLALSEALPVAVDLLVYTPAEFTRGIEEKSGVFDAIAREGVTLYARSAR